MSENGKNNHGLCGEGIKDLQKTHSEDGVDLTNIKNVVGRTCKKN